LRERCVSGRVATAGPCPPHGLREPARHDRIS
jgi:hypothetical protein